MSGALENERLNGLLAYLDRLIALEHGSYTLTREVMECITAIREEVALARPDVYSLKEGDTLTAKFEGNSERFQVTGPAEITMKRAKE